MMLPQNKMVISTIQAGAPSQADDIDEQGCKLRLTEDSRYIRHWYKELHVDEEVTRRP